MEVSLLCHSKDTCPRTVKLEQVLELIRTGNNLAMPICSVAAILEGGYRQKDTVRLTGLSVISYTAPESSSIAELREEARADPHTLLLFGTADTLNIIFSYELDQEYELRQQKLFYTKAFDFACDYYDQLMGVKTNRIDKGRMVQLAHDAEAYYNTYAEPFYAWEIKEANTAKREGRKPRGDPREHKQNWKEIYASVKDIQNFLDENIQLRHNIITRRVEFLKKDDDAKWKPIEDWHVNSLWSKMSEDKQVRIQDIYRVIESDFVKPFNPFTNYLLSLDPWNGCPAIELLSKSVTVKGGKEKQQLFYECLRRWLVGMVAGWVDDDVVNHEILVLIGDQGSYKTTWFQHLLPPELRDYFYIKSNASRMSRDDLLTLTQYGLICCEELDTMRPAELNQLKAAVTMKTVDERAAYARYHEHRVHIASFCGTGNNVQFLNDPTGNRRWLPFEVDYILDPRDNEPIWELVYAEAYHLYRNGFQYWFTRGEIAELSDHNEGFEAPKQELELIRQNFRLPGPGEKGEFITRTGIMQAIGWNPALNLDINKIGPAMKELGFKRMRTEKERGYVVCRYNEMEKCEQKWAKAAIAKEENEPENDNHDTIF